MINHEISSGTPGISPVFQGFFLELCQEYLPGFLQEFLSMPPEIPPEKNQGIPTEIPSGIANDSSGVTTGISPRLHTGVSTMFPPEIGSGILPRNSLVTFPGISPGTPPKILQEFLMIFFSGIPVTGILFLMKSVCIGTPLKVFGAISGGLAENVSVLKKFLQRIPQDKFQEFVEFS